VVRSRHQSHMIRGRGCHRGGLTEQKGSALRRAPNPVSFVVALLVSTLLLVGPAFPVAAQDATPSASPSAGAPPVVASGLTNPRGMTWGADGTLFVALAGNGGTSPAVGDPLPPPGGPGAVGGPSAAVAQIGPDGCPVAVATGLP